MSFRDEIFDIILQNPDCDTSEIADLYNTINGTNRDKNDFTKRVSELTQSGDIVASGKRLSPDTGKAVTTWAAAKRAPTVSWTVEYADRDSDHVNVKKSSLRTLLNQAQFGHGYTAHVDSCRKYTAKLRKIQQSRLYQWFAPLRFLVDELLVILYAYIQLSLGGNNFTNTLTQILDEEGIEL